MQFSIDDQAKAKSKRSCLEGGKQRKEGLKSMMTLPVQMSKKLIATASSAGDLFFSFVCAKVRLNCSWAGRAALQHVRICTSSSKGVFTLCSMEKCQIRGLMNLQSGEHLFRRIGKDELKESSRKIVRFSEKSR